MHFTQNLDHHHMAFPPTHHGVGGGFMFHSQVEDQNDHLPSPSSLPSCPPHLFPVSGGGGGANFLMKRSMSFSGVEKCGGGEEDELSDDGSQLGEKKKRLNLEQVKALEKSFEIGNKLEPERKMQLAKALGLQPRQIAIWFQNRRARWKTKQLEKDYEVLKKQFDSLKADNDALHAHNKKLHAELMNLKGIDSNEDIHNNMKKESDQRSWSNGSENSCDHNNNNNNNNIDTSPTLTTKHLFNTNSSSSMRSPTTTTSMTQLLQSGTAGSSNHHPQLVHHHQEENFCSMFEEQQNYWAWPEQHHPFSLNQSNFSNN